MPDRLLTFSSSPLWEYFRTLDHIGAHPGHKGKRREDGTGDRNRVEHRVNSDSALAFGAHDAFQHLDFARALTVPDGSWVLAIGGAGAAQDVRFTLSA